MDTKSAWMLPNELHIHLIQAGIGEQDILRAIAWACKSGRLVASGFPTFVHGKEHASWAERMMVSRRLWEVFDRTDPTYPHTETHRKKPFERIVRWDAGELTWTLTDGQTYVQESWRSVLFDRASAEAWFGELAARNNIAQLQDFELDEWISGSGTENSKTAWQKFAQSFGRRSVKREVFMTAWKRVKGNRSPGRIPKSARP